VPGYTDWSGYTVGGGGKRKKKGSTCPDSCPSRKTSACRADGGGGKEGKKITSAISTSCCTSGKSDRPANAKTPSQLFDFREGCRQQTRKTEKRPSESSSRVDEGKRKKKEGEGERKKRFVFTFASLRERPRTHAQQGKKSPLSGHNTAHGKRKKKGKSNYGNAIPSLKAISRAAQTQRKGGKKKKKKGQEKKGKGRTRAKLPHKGEKKKAEASRLLHVRTHPGRG